MPPVGPSIVRRGVWLLAAAASLWLGGCAVRPVTPELAKYEPDYGYRWRMGHELPDNDPQTLFVLTFSGGGTRAAAFSYGVLEELRRTVVHTPRGAHPALAEVDVITGTSERVGDVIPLNPAGRARSFGRRPGSPAFV